MDYLFICNSGEALPIAYRLQKEKQSVVCYIHNQKYRQNYDGMVKKVQMKGLLSAVEKADLVIFDMNKPVENAHDRNLQKVFKARGKWLYGSIADAIRKKGKRVLGVSTWTEQVELDRNKGSELAAQAGLKIPLTYEFSSLSEGAGFLGKQKKKIWVFKPYENQDLDLTYVERSPGELFLKLTGEYKKRLPQKTGFILQEVVDGVEISSEAWWTGSKWTCFNHTIEDKCFMNFDLGLRIGSANNTVWLKTKKGLNTDVFERLTPKIKQSGYVGPVDINCIVSRKDHKAYFLEFTPRLGYDAIYCLLALLSGSLTGFFEYVSELSSKKPRFRDGYASSIRVSVPPYPYEEPALLERAKGIDIGGDFNGMWLEDVCWNDGIKCCGADGIIGVMVGRGNSIGGSVGNVYRQIGRTKIAGYVQYRTDLGKRAQRAVKKLKEWQVEVG
jgi:phosphoribosylamine-glycine ligase